MEEEGDKVVMVRVRASGVVVRLKVKAGIKACVVVVTRGRRRLQRKRRRMMIA